MNKWELIANRPDGQGTPSCGLTKPVDRGRAFDPGEHLSIDFQSAKLNLKGTTEGLTLSNVTP